MSQVNRTIKDTGGTDRTVQTYAGTPGAIAAEGSDIRGIVVGSGATAVAISDYVLAAQIAHGVGAGQLYHYAATFTAPAVSGTSCSWTTTRVFANQSGATITVYEIGIYVIGVDTGLAARYFLVIRDVLATPQSVPDGGSVTVVYTVKVTV
jgi:hypothetical protein